ncbi:MAG: hypothetical protein WBD95_22285 [Xanthobacteraceae bacterium]
MAIRAGKATRKKHFRGQKAMEEFHDMPQSIGGIRILAMAMATVCGRI